MGKEPIIRQTSGGTNWRDEAACKEVDREMFFPEAQPSQIDGRQTVMEQAREVASRFCRRCPVSRECVLMALETKSSGGVFGGYFFRYAGPPLPLLPDLKRATSSELRLEAQSVLVGE